MWSYIRYEDPGIDDSAYAEWLASHPDDFVIISERKPRAARVTLHHATCGAISGDAPYDKPLGSSYVRVCGARDEIEKNFSTSEIQACPLCL
jgi:hypothetical protein